jgi:hypothetical protein
VVAVAPTLVSPWAFVARAEPSVADAPLPGGVNVTVAPGTGFPYWSSACTSKGREKAVPTVALCGVPDTEVSEAGTPAVFVSEKLAELATPVTEALTEYPPAIVLALAVMLVWPFVPVADAVPSTAEAPEPGGVNVTLTPATGFPYVSLTFTTSALKFVFTVALCGVPDTTATDAAAAAVFVSENITGVETPAAAAETE